MKKIFLFLLIIALPILIFTLTSRQENRSRAASETAAITVQPGGSIASAINNAQPGDVINVAAGTYNETLNITKSGSAGGYITIQATGGKVITNGTMKISGKYIKLIGFTVKGSSSFGAQVNGADNLVLQNFEIDGSQDGGLIISNSANVVVDSCNIHGTNAEGTSADGEALSITEVSPNFEIKNCQVHDNGEEGIDAKYNGAGNINGSIHNNVVFNNRGPNIYVDGSHGVKVYNNISYGAKEGSKAGISIAAETYYDGANNPRTAGNIDVFNNVTYGNAGGGISFYTESGGSIADIRVYNNTINESKPFAMATDSIGGSNPVFNNIFASNPSGAGLQIGKNHVGDGGFVGGGDYHLKAGSPAIDKGDSNGAPAFDLENKARPAGSGIDMGAYEYGATGGANPTGAAPTFPQPTAVTPTLFCLGGVPCTSPDPTTAATPPVGGVNPTTNPSTTGTVDPNTPNPTVSPCETQSSVQTYKHKKHKKHRHGGGNGGGFLSKFFEFLMKFLELILKQFGFTFPSNPNPVDPSPTPDPSQPCPEPTTEEPTVEPSIEPTIDETVTGQPGTSPTISTTPATGQVPVGKTVLFIGDYNVGNFTQWDVCQWKGKNANCAGYNSTDYMAKIVNDGPGHETAARYEVRSGDKPEFGGERSEVTAPNSVDVKEGDERWYEFSMKFPSDFQNPISNWFIVMQWHSSEGSPPLAIQVGNDDMLKFSNDRTGKTTNIGQIQRGKWVKYVFHVKFSQSSSAFAETWVDGVKQTAVHKQPNMSDASNYLKMGIYRGDQTLTHVVLQDDVRVTAP